MPPRRSHKKSRTGCLTCKSRKIKCDEIHPRCGQCAKHDRKCGFELVKAAAIEASSEPVSLPSPASSQRSNHSYNTASTTGGKKFNTSQPSPYKQSPSIIMQPTSTPPTKASLQSPSTEGIQTSYASLSSTRSSPVDRILELRLWHHFVTNTYQSLLQSIPGANDVLKQDMLQLALSGRTYLADAILAISALHLRSFSPNDMVLELASDIYSASALADYRSSLIGGIHEDNAEALLLTACLIAFKATASRIFINGRRDESNTEYPLPLAWFHAFQGIKTIAAVSWPWVSNSGIAAAVINSEIFSQLDLSLQGSNSFFGYLLHNVEDEFLLEDPLVNSMSPQGYIHAVSILNWAHQSPYPLAALVFPAAVSNRFVQLLEAKRPRALAIVACFFALLKRIDNVWWLGDVARREVTGIIGMFKPGSDWWRRLEWPIRIALWDGDGSGIPASIWGAECGEPTDKLGELNTAASHNTLLA